MGCKVSTAQQPEIQIPKIQIPKIQISDEEKEQQQRLYDEFYQACHDGNHDKIKIMIKNHPKINLFDHNRHKDALAHCYQQGCVEIIRWLISNDNISNIYIDNLMVVSVRLNHRDIWLRLFELKKRKPVRFSDYKLIKDILAEAMTNCNIDMIDLIQTKYYYKNNNIVETPIQTPIPNFIFKDLLPIKVWKKIVRVKK